MEGYVRLHREIINNPIFKKPLINHLFVYCLLRANHKDNKIVFNCQVVEVERGSFICGRKKLSEATGETEQNVRSALKTLQNLGMVQISTTKSTSKYSYITVCNYNDYQYNGEEGNQQTNHEATSNQPASNQQVTTDNNDNNLLNDINVDNNPPKSPQGENEDFEKWWTYWRSNRKRGDGGVKATAQKYYAKNRKKISQEQIMLATKNYLAAVEYHKDAEGFLNPKNKLVHQYINQTPTPKQTPSPEPNRTPPKTPDLTNHRKLVRIDLQNIKTREAAAEYFENMRPYLREDQEVLQMFERFM